MSDLAGFTVAVTADRRRDEQALLLERAGFEVAMFPLLRTEATGDGPLKAVTEQISKYPPDYLVANTGYGMRAWFAQAAMWGLLSDLTDALGTKTMVAARGAKALGELRKVGLDAFYKAPSETLEEVVERLLEEGVAGKEVAVQLHGEAAGEELSRLERAGARVTWVSVYRMAGAAREAEAPGPETALARAIAGGSLDAVTFTAAPQVQALFVGADVPELLSAFNGGGVVAACIGPVCAGAANALGIETPLVPPHSRLGSLATALTALFADKKAELRGEHGEVALSGRFVSTQGHIYELEPVERRALRKLLAAGAPLRAESLGVTEAQLSRLSRTVDGALRHSGDAWALVFSGKTAENAN